MILRHFFISVFYNPKIRFLLNWILEFIYIQSYVTLLSLPILIAWGLPFSLLSPLGNLIFNPFIFIFLLLSSLLFFTALLGITIPWLSHALDYSTAWWLGSMSLAPHQCALSFAEPHWIFLLIVPLITLAIVHHPLTRSKTRSVVCFLLLFFICSSLTPRPKDNLSIPYNNGTITVLHRNKKTVIIDPGIIGKRPSGKQWAQYELIPTITKNIGDSAIDTIICLQPNATAFEALEQMCRATRVEHIIVPYWEGTASKGMNRAWYNLKKTAHSYDTDINRLGKYPKEVPGWTGLTIKPANRIISSGNFSYSGYHLLANLDDNPFIISSARL